MYEPLPRVQSLMPQWRPYLGTPGQLSLTLSLCRLVLVLSPESCTTFRQKKKRERKRETSVIFCQPLLRKVPGWCHLVPVGTTSLPAAAYSPVCLKACQLCGGGRGPTPLCLTYTGACLEEDLGASGWPPAEPQIVAAH